MDKSKKFNKLNDFLNKIKQIESSGGIDVNHQPMQTGIHAGDSAVGGYGLMPNTVNELVNRQRLRGTITPELEGLQNLSTEDLRQRFTQQPEIEQQFADQLGQRVLERSGGDPDKAAYMWNMGHNLNPASITPEKLEQSNYMQKFRRLKESLNKKGQ